MVPWFIIEKASQSGPKKFRLISDCRVLNSALNPPKFRLENWKDILPQVRKGDWGVKLDIKNAYFHLENSPRLKPYLRLLIGGKLFQMEGEVFGLSTMPFDWQKLMNTFLKKWRQGGLTVFIYLDDILLLGPSPESVRKALRVVLTDLDSSGLLLNMEKSVIEPVQELDHLGFHLNLKEGLLQVPAQKMKTIRKELGKLLTHSVISPRKVSSILGVVRAFLLVIPSLRVFSDSLVRFIGNNSVTGWDTPLQLPQLVKEQVRELNTLFQDWKGRKLGGGKINLRQFHSDSSQWAWGGGHCTGGPCTRMVEGRIIPPHKSKGIKGCSRYSPGPGKARGHSALVSRQHCCIQLPKETRREKTSFQQHTETPVGTLHKKGYNFVTKFSGLQRLPGRQYFQMASGQGRLSIKPPHLFRNNKDIPGLPGPQSGHVCLPWKQTVTPVGGEVSPPWSSRLQRLRNASGPSRDARGGICQPPLVHNKPMATQTKAKPQLRVPSTSAPMGWMYMVAPTNQAAKQAMPSFGYSPQVGPFHQLPGREDATYKVAPPLSGFIRKMLQAKQVSAENITLYLTGIKSLDRYDKAFRTLCASILARGGPSNPVLTGHC